MHGNNITFTPSIREITNVKYLIKKLSKIDRKCITPSGPALRLNDNYDISLSNSELVNATSNSANITFNSEFKNL